MQAKAASSRLTLFVLAALVALTIAARLLPGPRTIDDAFITFRYSRNLVEGQGFVYNPSVHTLGTTTPLFALLNAGLSLLTGGQDFPHYAIVWSALADSGTVICLYLLARRLTGSALFAALPAALWAVAPMSVTFAVGGMETSVNIWWMALATWLFAGEVSTPRRRDILIGAAAAFGVLTRADAALWIAPLLLAQWIDRARHPLTASPIERLPWRTWLTGALIFLPWALFSLAYFGSPIPNSVTAKQFAYLLEPTAALVRLIQTYATPFQEQETFGALGAMIGALAYLLLSAIGLPFAARRLPRALPFLLYPWLYLLVFAAANPLIFRWYMAPPLPALITGVALGLWALLGPLLTRPGAARAVGRAAIALVGALWLFTSLNAWTLHPDHGPDRPAPRMAWHAIELLYQQMGTRLSDDYGVTAQTRVASADIGAIGYFSRATIVDTVGLVTPELTRYYPVDPTLVVEGQNYAIPPALIADTAPEYLVTMEAFVRLGLAREAWFIEDYALVDSFPADFYGTSMQLYQRR